MLQNFTQNDHFKKDIFGVSPAVLSTRAVQMLFFVDIERCVMSKNKSVNKARIENLDLSFG